MRIFSVKLPIIRKNENFLDIFIKVLQERGENLEERDIVVISEKIIAVSQGRVQKLDEIKNISEKAKKLAKKYEMDKRIVELILREATMILGGLKHVLLAKVDDFLIANAGIDQSNAGLGNVILLPENPKKIVWSFWDRLREEFKIDDLGVIISDSRVQPLRKGTIGIALATAGFEPIEDVRGQKDLFGREMQITLRAIADDLASAAQFVIGETNTQTPIAVIRGAQVEFTENPQLDTEMPPEEDLYMNIFSKFLLKTHKEKFDNGELL